MNTSITHSADLEDLALELGATVHHEDGSVFNSAKRSGAQRMRRAAPAPDQPPTPQPAPAPQQDNTALIQSMMQMVQGMQPQAPVIHSAPAQVVIQPPARCAWDFTFTRNRDGSIQSITATPKE